MTDPLPGTDVVIIGLGAAGGIASHVLTQAGLDVVAIEAGPWLTTDDFVSSLDEMHDFFHLNTMGPKVNQEVPTFRRNASAPRSAPPAVGRTMNAVGGTTVHYMGQTWRFLEDDFRIRSATVDRYGIGALPEGSAVVDWPITYADLEPFYELVEYHIGVSGDGTANPFAAPRARDFPLPPLRPRGISELAAATMREMGFHPFPQNAAILSEPYDGRPACTYCGYCGGFGCWNDSKSSTLVSAIPAAMATGRLEVRANCRVMRLVSNDRREIVAVEYLDDQGVLQTQPAGVVILSAFIYENIRLMLLSRSDSFPDGVGNSHGQVGKYYTFHPYSMAYGLFEGRTLNTFNGATAQGIAVDDFNGDHFDHEGLGFIRGGLILVGPEDKPMGAASTLPPDVPAWGPEYKRFLRDHGRSIANFLSSAEFLPYEANFLDLDPDVTDPLGVPVIRVTADLYDNEKRLMQFMLDRELEILDRMGATTTWGFVLEMVIHAHAFGGARMGDDPATSVTNRYSLVHDAPNLAVLGGATFCNATAYNPTHTIQALAWMSAQHIAESFDSIAVG